MQNEVNILSGIHHPNIICQLGCSSEGDSKLIVYELMENGSLETQLHGNSFLFLLSNNEEILSTLISILASTEEKIKY